MSMHLEPLAATSRQVQMQFSVKSTIINMDAEDAKALIDFFYEKINQRETFQNTADAIPGLIMHVIDLPVEEVEKIKKIFNVINLPNVSTIDIPEGTSIEILRRKSSFSSVKSMSQESAFLELFTSRFPCFR